MGSLRKVIHAAIDAEWRRRIADKVIAPPSGHIDALTDAVAAALQRELLEGTDG